MLRLRLRTKLLATIIISTIIVFGSFLYFNNYLAEKLSKDQAIDLAKSLASDYASQCKNYMDIEMGYAFAVTDLSRNYIYYNDEERDSVVGRIFSKMLERKPQYLSIWNTIEIQHTDTSYKKDYGRRSLTAIRSNNEISIGIYPKDMDGHNVESDFYKAKINKTAGVMEPYVDIDVGEFLITTVMAPIIDKDEFIGLGGIDFPLDIFQTFVDSLEIVDGATAIVATNKGVILGHTNSEFIGDSISSVMSHLNQEKNLLDIIQAGMPDGFEYDENGKTFYTAIVPFYVKETYTPWAFGISIPIEPFLEAARKNSRSIIWIGVLGMTLMFILIYFIASQIVGPLTKTTNVFKELATGNIKNSLKLKIKTGDELQNMSDSVNSLIDSLQKTESFAQEIEKGNLDAEFDALGDNDQLGNALLNMRSGLKEAKERDEARRVEDQRRNWALDGLTTFADLLREDSSDFEEYMRNIISKLANYTNSNQGGIYLINDNDDTKKTIELAGSYAFEGEKFDKKVLEFGEGLIGVSIMEAKTSHITNLPENYLSVSSGLGSNPPGSLIIAPLKHNDEVIGAIELASFTDYEDYQIKFIEDVAESIAVTIESLRMQQKSSLLLEQTQQQAEEMMAQEEELRQNMEEMMATQEENTRMVEDLQEELKHAKNELSKKKKK